MEEIIAIIKSDAVLKSLVGNNIVPFGQSGIVECLMYEFSPSQNNKAKVVDRLNLTSVAFSISKAKQILDRVNEIILTLGDTKLTNKIKKVSLNGGGSLSNQVGDKTMYHFKAYFNVTRRA